ncbi:MAG: hypothetical protein IIB27_07105 [Chloroflexi bacterium]|nr:hypothetical protein [Chloroflexota bacterium]
MDGNVVSGTLFRGTQAHVVTLVDDVFLDPKTQGKKSYAAGLRFFANYRARLLDSSGTDLGDFRILSHTTKQLFLDPVVKGTELLLPPTATHVEIIAKFFSVSAGTTEGLGEVYELKQGQQTNTFPKSNVQIGFAFHTDPSNPSGVRFPKDANKFIFDLTDPTFVGNKNIFRFVMMRVRFNLNYDPVKPNTNPGPNPVTSDSGSQLSIREVVLPLRF